MGVNIRVRNGMEPADGSGGVNEGDLRGVESDIVKITGAVDLLGGHLLVHQAASPAMTVVVDKGVWYIENDSYDETDFESIRFWEAVVAGTTASRTLAIDSNSSGQTRYDLACIKIDPAEAPDKFGSDISELIIVKGTPGAGVPATPTYYDVLAEIEVINGAVTITDAKITDKRTQVVLNDATVPNAMIAATDAATVHIDASVSRLQSVSLGGDRTIVFDNITSKKPIGIFIESNGHAVTWPAGIDWPGGNDPSLSADGVDCFVVVPKDTWTVAVPAYWGLFGGFGM